MLPLRCCRALRLVTNPFLMYEMLCGHTPYVAQSVGDIFSRIHKDSITFGPAFKNMPEAVDLIKKLCHKDPKQRLGCRCCC
jgi:serine/threonine protein kinase